MKHIGRGIVMAALVLAAGPSFALNVGDAAVPVAPDEWLNAPAGMSWSQLEGRLVLVEKWATWCGPCLQTIPHLNELHEKYGTKGLTVIGVTKEPAGTVKPFSEKQQMKYLIALCEAPEYETSGIPHAWLVSSERKVVWKGHPASLTNAIIEEHIKTVRLAPKFELPPELSAAERQLNAGTYGAGIKALETHLKKPKSADTEAAAKAALEKVTKYGTDQLARAEELGKAREYAEGAEALSAVEKAFKGTALGDKARAKLDEWKKDKAIKTELDGGKVLKQAEALAQAKKYRDAYGLLLGISKQKKYEGTRVREVAEERMLGLQRKI